MTTQRKQVGPMLSKMNQFEIEGCLIMDHQPLLLFISVESQKSEKRGFLSFLPFFLRTHK